MGLSRVAAILVLATATFAIACSDPASGPLHASYSLQLQADSAEQYFVPECIGASTMYCRAWRPSSSISDVSLVGAGLLTRLVQDSKTLTMDNGEFNFDSLPFRLSNTQGYCLYLTMRLTISGSDVRGTWSQQQDCHGRTAAGRVVGTRN